MTVQVEDGVEYRVRMVLAKLLCHEFDYVKEASSLGDDLGADSLDKAEAVIVIENEFGIEISDNEVEQMLTVADVIKIVRQKVQPC